MEFLRPATKYDFKIGTTLIDCEGNEFTLRRKYDDGIWECNDRVHFESSADTYKVKQEKVFCTVKQEGKKWQELPQIVLKGKDWADVVGQAKKLSSKHNCEVRVSEDEGYRGQGYYFMETA